MSTTTITTATTTNITTQEQPPQTVLIIGATSGIGLSLVETLFTQPQLVNKILNTNNLRVIATARNEQSSFLVLYKN